MRHPKKSFPNLKNKGIKKKSVSLSYWIMKIILETGWTIEEVKKCPIPLFWALVDVIQEREKEQSEMFT